MAPRAGAGARGASAGARVAGAALRRRAGRCPGARPARVRRAPLSPEMLAGMLEAARQSLFAGRYSEAIAAYQAVLKRDARNVDAMSHLGFIVAIGGHADAALETFDKALAIDPNYPPAYLFRGQVLSEVKRDYAAPRAPGSASSCSGAGGADHDQVKTLLAEARAEAAPSKATRQG